MDFGIAGRKAAVAAASKGLGYATAAALAREGVAVAICGRDRTSIEQAAASIGALATPLVADVSQPDGAIGFVAAARDALGGLDILVTNAGGPPPGNFASTAVEQYLPGLNLNLLSVVAMCKEAVPGMQAQHWGRVVAITGWRQVAPPLRHAWLVGEGSLAHEDANHGDHGHGRVEQAGNHHADDGGDVIEVDVAEGITGRGIGGTLLTGVRDLKPRLPELVPLRG